MTLKVKLSIKLFITLKCTNKIRQQQRLLQLKWTRSVLYIHTLYIGLYSSSHLLMMNPRFNSGVHKNKFNSVMKLCRYN